MKKIILIISYILIFFNPNVSSSEKENLLKIGLLAPLSGEYKELGTSLLYSLQLALDEINDERVLVIPGDTGSNNSEKLLSAINEIKSQGVNIVIGPLNYKDFRHVRKFNDMVFISLSNINPEFKNNIISIGISLESQLTALIKFLNKRKNKTIVMIPNNEYTDLVETKLSNIQSKKFKIFKYNPDPKVLTGEMKNLQIIAREKKFGAENKNVRR